MPLSSKDWSADVQRPVRRQDKGERSAVCASEPPGERGAEVRKDPEADERI